MCGSCVCALQRDDAWVLRPRNRRVTKPKGVVHFLGGAFAGAAPQVSCCTLISPCIAHPRCSSPSVSNSIIDDEPHQSQVVYSLLLELIASAGYTVVATPYAVTFQHLECADSLRARFLAALQV